VYEQIRAEIEDLPAGEEGGKAGLLFTGREGPWRFPGRYGPGIFRRMLKAGGFWLTGVEMGFCNVLLEEYSKR